MKLNGPFYHIKYTHPLKSSDLSNTNQSFLKFYLNPINTATITNIEPNANNIP